MAEESFEDEETAAVINQNYVPIKVDREERPDIDAVYMSVCQALTGQGGWPLNVFLTPSELPFYAGTYFPKTSQYGRPSFKDVLLSLRKQYEDQPEKIQAMGTLIVDQLSKKTKSQSKLSDAATDQAYEQLKEHFDPEYGGFGSAPKFPSPHQLLFLMRYYRLKKEDKALEMVRKTLDGMAQGGIHDQIGGGFARYSVDREWRIPHFEKMLYDQALLILAFVEMFQIKRRPEDKKIIESTIAYCERELLQLEGGFYCAEDADSEGMEGYYYLWTPEEVRNILGSETGTLFCAAYHVTEAGNFNGKNIPNSMAADFSDLARMQGVSEERLSEILDGAKQKLLEVRNQRVHPHKDDKILTSWNALMIMALAKAGQALHNIHYVKLAEDAFQFIENRLTVSGRLMARYRDGETKFSAYLDDYAFYALSCESLYAATFRSDYLKKMKQLTDQMIHLFWDPNDGGFRLYSHDQERLILDPKDAYDGAIPSGNSAATDVLLRLSERTGNRDYRRLAERVFDTFADGINAYPAGYSYMLGARMSGLSHPKELVVLKGTTGEDFENAVQKLQALFLPEVTLFAGTAKTLADLNEQLAFYSPISGHTTYFLCEQFACHQPVTQLKKLIDQIE